MLNSERLSRLLSLFIVISLGESSMLEMGHPILRDKTHRLRTFSSGRCKIR